MVMTPPAPIPQKARPRIKLSMLFARAHHVVAAAKMPRAPTKSGFRPRASESRPSKGWKADEVRRKAVESHDAEFEALKYDVMTGCDEAMIVPSKQDMKYAVRIWEKMNQKRVGDVLLRNGVSISVTAEVVDLAVIEWRRL
jgi:hypothetical protein